MTTSRYVYWPDGDMWLGYLEEFPDYMTQGEALDELQENLKRALRRADQRTDSQRSPGGRPSHRMSGVPALERAEVNSRGRQPPVCCRYTYRALKGRRSIAGGESPRYATAQHVEP